LATAAGKLGRFRNGKPGLLRQVHAHRTYTRCIPLSSAWLTSVKSGARTIHHAADETSMLTVWALLDTADRRSP
jgi:hypothetical protein